MKYSGISGGTKGFSMVFDEVIVGTEIELDADGEICGKIGFAGCFFVGSTSNLIWSLVKGPRR